MAISMEEKSPMVVFAGGGTGGHLFPAIAVAGALQAEDPRVRCVFFGTRRGIDATILRETKHELVRQHLPALRRAPWSWPDTAYHYWREVKRCRERFVADRPCVVVGTGSFSSVPAVREAYRRGIPVVLLNPDAKPGRANRHLAPMAAAVAAQWEETVTYFPPRVDVRVIGCPVRPAFATASRERARAHWGLEGRPFTLLVTGASQGARSINEAVIAILSFLAMLDDWQVLHIAGEEDFDRVSAAFDAHHVASRVVRFTHEMPLALAAADLVISRAGASTLAEIAVVGLPSVLMPYPFHKDMHQLANARCLERAGAARVVLDGVDPSQNAPWLRRVLEPLLASEVLRRSMAAAARASAYDRAADDVAKLILHAARASENSAAPEMVMR